MHERLKALEHQSRQLDPTPAVFDGWMGQITEFSNRFLAELDNRPASTAGDVSVLRRGFNERGEELSAALALLQNHVFSTGFDATSGKFLGYIPGGGIPTAAIGDFLAALTNRYAGVYAASPGAAEIENECVRWMCELVGYDSSAWGTLQSGGTLATLTALTVARDTRRPPSGNAASSTSRPRRTTRFKNLSASWDCTIPGNRSWQPTARSAWTPWT